MVSNVQRKSLKSSSSKPSIIKPSEGENITNSVILGTFKYSMGVQIIKLTNHKLYSINY